MAKVNGLELTVPDFTEQVTTKTPEFLAKFPLGTFPTFESSTGFRMTESNAIAYHFADSGPKRDQLLGSTIEERALIQNWIFFSELQLEPTFWRVFLWRRGRTPYVAKTEASGAALLPGWLHHLEVNLKGKKWLLGDTEGPSLADLTIASVMFLAYWTYVDAEMRPEYPEIMRWYKQVQAIPELVELFAGEWVEKRIQPPAEEGKE